MEPLDAPPKVGQRPFLITLLCAAAFVACLWTVAASRVPEVRASWQKHGAPWFPAFMDAMALGMALSFALLWRMRRAGVLGLIVLTAVLNAVMLKGLHLWTPSVLIVPALITLIVLGYVPRMR